MAGVEGCSDFCMGAVFMSVILRGMPVKAQRAQSRQRTRRRCSRHNTASRRRGLCSWSLAGKRGPHSVAAAGFSKGAACRTVERPAFPIRPGNPGPFLATRPLSTSSSPRAGLWISGSVQFGPLCKASRLRVPRQQGSALSPRPLPDVPPDHRFGPSV